MARSLHFLSSENYILVLREDYYTVPVVGRVRLDIAAFCIDSQAILGDTVFVDEDLLNSLGTTLGEIHIILGSTGLLVGITLDHDLGVGIGLHPLGDVVYIYHFGIGHTG